MNDKKIWEMMIDDDLTTSTLVENIGLIKTISAYKDDKQYEILQEILSKEIKLFDNR